MIMPLSSVQYELDDEQKSLFEDIQKANALKQLKACQGWEILTDTLESLRTQAVDTLVAVQPGDTERIQAAHAVAYAVTNTINNLRMAVDNAIVRGDTEAPQRLQEIKQIQARSDQGFADPY
jgi:hypothetical protein